MRRHHLSKKKIKEIKKNLAMDVWPDAEQIEILENKRTLILFDGIPMLFYYDGKYCPTVLLLLNMIPEGMYVTVDMGAVKHILKGADVFAAGVVDADPNIRAGDCVYVRDEKYKKPIAVGFALMEGEEMMKSAKGKAVKNLHHYGDEITQS